MWVFESRYLSVFFIFCEAVRLQSIPKGQIMNDRALRRAQKDPEAQRGHEGGFHAELSQRFMALVLNPDLDCNNLFRILFLRF